MKNEQLLRDLIQGMRDRAAYIFADNENPDRRNDNWYAREVYGEKYERIRRHFQDEKLEEIETENYK